MISVIVPVFNTSEYLDRCLTSLVGQSYTDFEIILIDDGSTDSSPALCDEWAAKDSRIRVCHKENGGLISAWKTGVGMSKGDYLTFLDSDDWVDTAMLQEMSICLSGMEGEIIASDYVIERTRSDGSFSQEYVYQALAPGEYSENDIKESVIPILLGQERRPVTISRCMKLISRALIVSNMDYTEESIRMGEDLSVMVPALYDCKRLVIMDHKAYYHYFYASESMVHKYDKGMYQNFLNLKKICSRVIEDKFQDSPLDMEKQLKALDREFVLWLLLCVKNEARGNETGYRLNIRQIYASSKELIKATPIEVMDMANRLVYLTLKKPSGLRLSILRLAMIVYYH